MQGSRIKYKNKDEPEGQPAGKKLAAWQDDVLASVGRKSPETETIGRGERTLKDSGGAMVGDAADSSWTPSPLKGVKKSRSKLKPRHEYGAGRQKTEESAQHKTIDDSGKRFQNIHKVLG